MKLRVAAAIVVQWIATICEAQFWQRDEVLVSVIDPLLYDYRNYALRILVVGRHIEDRARAWMSYLPESTVTIAEALTQSESQ